MESDEQQQAQSLRPKAEQDKRRYERQMKHYVPPDPEDDEEEDNSRGKRRRKKDPNAPKRPKSAFMFFTKFRRPTLKREDPSITFTEFGRLIGQEWRRMSVHERRQFQREADRDSKRYEREMRRYR